MSPKTKEQNEKIRRDKRQLILDKALEIFATYGYHDASVRIIAKHAGIAKGLLYEYFPSKDELLKTIVNEGFRDFFDLFPRNKDQKFPEDLLTPEIFRNLFKQVFSMITNHLDFWRLYMALAFQPGVMEILIKDYEGLMFTQLDLLEQYYQAQGSRFPRADAIHTYIMLDGIILNYLQTHNEFTREEL